LIEAFEISIEAFPVSKKEDILLMKENSTN
jgi:hypothetical protein